MGKKLGKLGKIWTELGGKVKKFGQKMGKLGTKWRKWAKNEENGEIWAKKKEMGQKKKKK